MPLPAQVRRPLLFDSVRGLDGKVRSGVWDYVCVPGHDEKDGQSTDFNRETLSQMIDNFIERGDPIPIDFNHQSNYAHINGQPAPALGWYTALALVWDGAIVKMGQASGVSGVTVEAPGLSPETCDLSRPGLWAYRGEVTELGHELLPNFKLLSPTFMAEATRRDGTEIGYFLAAVAATNTPWQGGTQITFDGAQKMAAFKPGDLRAGQGVEYRSKKTGGTRKGRVLYQPDSDPNAGFYVVPDDDPDREESVTWADVVRKFEGDTTMAKFAKLAKFAGVDEGADASAIKTALAETMTKLAADAMMSDDPAALEDAACKLDDAASEMEDGDEDKVKMAAMSQKFRKMAKFAAEGDDEKPEDKPSEMDDAPPAAMAAAPGDKAAMAVMQASLAAVQAKLAKFEKAEAARAKAEKVASEAKFSQLADAAVKGGYPAESRAALITFARQDFAAAQKAVAPFIGDARPEHLFGRVTAMGGPLGGSTESRGERGPKQPKVVKSAFGRFVETDGEFAEEVRKVAESKDPATMARVDKLIPNAADRPQMFSRLLAARNIVAADRPDLAEQAGE